MRKGPRWERRKIGPQKWGGKTEKLQMHPSGTINQTLKKNGEFNEYGIKGSVEGEKNISRRATQTPNKTG